jgi:hypothetical protein
LVNVRKTTVDNVNFFFFSFTQMENNQIQFQHWPLKKLNAITQSKLSNLHNINFK